MLSIHLDLAAALRIFRGCVAETRQFLRTRRQQFKVSKVAVQDRQIFNILLAELYVHVRAIRLQLRDVARDFYRLCYSANLQSSVESYRGVGVYRNAFPRISLKSGRFYLHLVIVWNQVGDRVVAAFVRGRFERGALRDRSYRDFRAAYRISLRVRHRPDNAAEHSLA